MTGNIRDPLGIVRIVVIIPLGKGRNDGEYQ